MADNLTPTRENLVMEGIQEASSKRNADELSSDSADSTPSSPVFKKPCKGSTSLPSSPSRRIESRTTRSQTNLSKAGITTFEPSKDEIMSLYSKRQPKPVTVESLSTQISVLLQSMEDFKKLVKKDNAKNTEDLKRSIKEIAGVVPRVDTLESSYKKLDKDVNGKSGLTNRMSTVESEVKTFKTWNTSIKKLQEGFRGIEPRIQKIEKFVKTTKAITGGSSSSVTVVKESEDSKLEEEVEDLRSSYSAKFDYIVGWMEKMHCNQSSLQVQADANASKGMQYELRIGGLTEDTKENCKAKVLEFFKDQVNVTLQNFEVLFAYCLGRKSMAALAKAPRTMITKVLPQLKEKVMSNVKNLKGKTDPKTGAKCFVVVNEPESYKAAKKKYKPMLDRIREENAKRPPKKRLRARMSGTKLLVNNKVFEEVIQPPSPAEVLKAMEVYDTLLEKLTFVETAIHYTKGNAFKGYAISLSKLHSVHLAYCKLKGLFPTRDHIMMAYHISSARGSCDDKEYFGDLQIAEMISSQGRTDIAVFVARACGQKLGAKRFEIIRMITQELFTALDTKTNSEVVDSDIPEWDKKQLSVDDLLDLPIAENRSQEQPMEEEDSSIHSQND